MLLLACVLLVILAGVEAVGVVVVSEVWLVIAVVISHTHHGFLLPLPASAGLGTLIGSLLGYQLGTRRQQMLWQEVQLEHTSARILTAQKFFASSPARALLVLRWRPAPRTMAAQVAGAAGYPRLRFISLTVATLICWLLVFALGPWLLATGTAILLYGCYFCFLVGAVVTRNARVNLATPMLDPEPVIAAEQPHQHALHQVQPETHSQPENTRQEDHD